MEKQIRHASKRSKGKGKNTRRNLSKVFTKSGNTWNETVRSLQDGTSPIKQGPDKKIGEAQGTKTIEVIDGIPQFFIVIPCMAGTPDRKSPLYLVEENELGGVESGVWQCQECTKIYYTRKAWAKHAGMISNIMGNCPGG